MIRINLLGAPKAKEQAGRSFGGRRHGSGRRWLTEDEGPGGAGAGCACVNAGYWYQPGQRDQDIAAKMQVAEQKNRELADVKARYLERQRQADNYKRRVDVIDQLRASPVRPGQPAEHDRRHHQRHRSGVAEHA